MWEYGTYTPYENPYNIAVVNDMPPPLPSSTTSTAAEEAEDKMQLPLPPALSPFHPTRQILRAGLIACLLVFGHVLVGTAISGDAHLVRSLGPAFRSTSALLFLTLLWQAFSLLEQADVPFARASVRRSAWAGRRRRQRHKEGDVEETETDGLVFSMTWVEFVHNAILLGCWASWSDRARSAYTALRLNPNELGMEFVVLPVAATGLLACLTAMQAQLCLAIAYHAWTQGFSAICTTAFWTDRTGHWTERVCIDHDHGDDDNTDEDEGGISDSTYPAEKVDTLV